MNTRTLMIDVTFGLTLGMGVLLWQNVTASENTKTSFQVEKVYSVQDSEGAVHVCEPLNFLAATSGNRSVDAESLTLENTKWHCYLEESESPLSGSGVIGVSTDDAKLYRTERFDI